MGGCGLVWRGGQAHIGGMNGLSPDFFDMVFAVLAGNAITLLGIYAVAKANRTEIETGEAATRYIIMGLVCAGLGLLVVWAAQAQ